MFFKQLFSVLQTFLFLEIARITLICFYFKVYLTFCFIHFNVEEILCKEDFGILFHHGGSYLSISTVDTRAFQLQLGFDKKELPT